MLPARLDIVVNVDVRDVPVWCGDALSADHYHSGMADDSDGG